MVPLELLSCLEIYATAAFFSFPIYKVMCIWEMVIILSASFAEPASFNFFLIILFSVIYRGAHIAANMIASNKEIATKVGRAYSSNLLSD